MQVSTQVSPIICMVVMLFSFGKLGAQEVYFEMDSVNTTQDGYIKLAWEGPNEVESYEIQESTSRNFETFRTVYTGPDKATFISGLKDGDYYYRLRREGGNWTTPIVLTVTHHSLELAFILFGLGALVFILTVWVVISGARASSTTT